MLNAVISGIGRAQVPCSAGDLFKTRVVHDLVDPVFDLFEIASESTVFFKAALIVARLADAGNRRGRAFHKPYYLTHGYLRGIAGKQNSALRAPDGLNITRAFERSDYLLEEFFGYILPFGNILYLRYPAVIKRQVKDDLKGVIAFECYFQTKNLRK